MRHEHEGLTGTAEVVSVEHPSKRRKILLAGKQGVAKRQTSKEEAAFVNRPNDLLEGHAVHEMSRLHEHVSCPRPG